MPILRSKDEVCNWLFQQRDYKQIALWIKRGQLHFECGNDRWNPAYYCETAWEKKSWPLVFGLAYEMRKADNFKLYYDANQDFHHIEFDLDNERYDVRWYKIYSVTRITDGATWSFNSNEKNVIDFFKRGEHRKKN